MLGGGGEAKDVNLESVRGHQLLRDRTLHRAEVLVDILRNQSIHPPERKTERKEGRKGRKEGRERGREGGREGERKGGRTGRREEGRGREGG